MPLEQKISRLAADFAARIVGALTAAPIDELLELGSSGAGLGAARASREAPKATRADRPAKRDGKAVRSVRRPSPGAAASEGRSAASAASATSAASAPSAEATGAALAFFRERGARGATAPQLGERLAELGLGTTAAATAAIVAKLADSGEIRDAGFRRAAGKNATASVFVAT